MMEIKKILVVGVILFFIGVAVAPIINFSVVKASQEDDLVEVTTQVCGIEPRGVKRGTVRIHFYEDLDNDSVFDNNEPSPPLFIVYLKTQDSNPGSMISRIKIIGCRGNALFRFVPLPANYNLTARYQHDPFGMGIMTEIWMYSGEVYLNESVMRNTLYLPIRHIIIPI
jgi:hypothetical protein